MKQILLEQETNYVHMIWVYKRMKFLRNKSNKTN